MSRHRTHRADGNQGEIVSALRATGCSVLCLSQVGNGCPDLLIGRSGVMLLLEIKLPSSEPTGEQLVWHAEHDGFKIAVAHSVDEAIEAVNRTVRRSKTA